jgi:tetrahydromethanopterin S-methyltransferase subunit G
MHRELDTDERVDRAYQYATQHDSKDLPDIKRRLDEAEQQIKALMAMVSRLAGHRPVVESY